MATSEFAVDSLHALLRHGHDIVACYSKKTKQSKERI